MHTIRVVAATLSVAFAQVAATATSHAADLSRLDALLNATPAGGWVQINTSSFSSAFPTGASAVDVPSYSDPARIVHAWSSFAWNTDLGSLMLFGGGHANYAGNEMYLWDGASGAWSRGSLPSKLDSYGFVADNSAPQSAHTYDNQLYLRVNRLFVTLGGAAYQSGDSFQAQVGGQVVRTGPWLFDPARANANEVGGSSGSGYDRSSIGGNMWIDRRENRIGNLPQSFVEAATAYRTENGKDVVYVAADSYSSGYPILYRYAVGNVRDGESDVWEVVGTNTGVARAFQGAAAIDSDHGLFVRTTSQPWEAAGSASDHDLIVWDLNEASAAAANGNLGIHLVDQAGAAFEMTRSFGIDYDQKLRRFFIWDSNVLGEVYSFAAEYSSDGGLLDTWTVSKLISATTDHPDKSFSNGVLGKWQYVNELGAFIAMAPYSEGDAGVWLYKPTFGVTTPVPELPVSWMLFPGLLLGGIWFQRRRPDACGREEPSGLSRLSIAS